MKQKSLICYALCISLATSCGNRVAEIPSSISLNQTSISVNESDQVALIDLSGQATYPETTLSIQSDPYCSGGEVLIEVWPTYTYTPVTVQQASIIENSSVFGVILADGTEHRLLNVGGYTVIYEDQIISETKDAVTLINNYNLGLANGNFQPPGAVPKRFCGIPMPEPVPDPPSEPSAGGGDSTHGTALPRPENIRYCGLSASPCFDPFPSGPDKRWPDGRIPYSFHSSVTKDQEAVIRAQIFTWNSKVSEVKYVYDPTSPTRAVFMTGDPPKMPGVNGMSMVGVHNPGNPQPIIINQDTYNKTNIIGGVILHEMGHNAGLRHPNQHPTSRYYIEFSPNATPEFMKLHGTEEPGYWYTPFDYSSIMNLERTMYVPTANGTSLPHMGDPSQFGQRSYLSEGDILTLNRLYAPIDRLP